MADVPSQPHDGSDPRLRIPDVLRTPVKKPEMLREYEQRDREASSPAMTDTTKQAAGWAIAMNFVWTLAAAGLLGWAIQRWAWPSAAPWPLLVGLFVGLAAGMGRFIRDALKANREP